jgi:hypothetical protein
MWLGSDFLTGHNHRVTTSTIDPQEDPHLDVPWAFLNAYFDLVLIQVAVVSSMFVYNLDETRYSDEEEWKSDQGIGPVERVERPIHVGVTHRIKH